MLVSKRIRMTSKDEKLSRVPAEPNASFIDAATPLVLDGNYKYGLYKCQLYKAVAACNASFSFPMSRIRRFDWSIHLVGCTHEG